MNAKQIASKLKAMGFFPVDETPGFNLDYKFRHCTLKNNQYYGSLWLKDGVMHATGRRKPQGYRHVLVGVVKPSGYANLSARAAYWEGDKLKDLLAKMPNQYQRCR